MQTEVTVLVAANNVEMALSIRRSLQGAGFKVVTTPELYEALRYLPAVDCLLLDEQLANGVCIPVLEEWSRTKRGPACILAEPGISVEKKEGLFSCGAWNVLTMPVSLDILGVVFQHYGVVVTLKESHVTLEQKISKLTKWFWVLSIMTAVALGEQFLPLLGKLIGVI